MNVPRTRAIVIPVVAILASLATVAPVRAASVIHVGPGGFLASHLHRGTH